MKLAVVRRLVSRNCASVSSTPSMYPCVFCHKASLGGISNTVLRLNNRTKSAQEERIAGQDNIPSCGPREVVVGQVS